MKNSAFIMTLNLNCQILTLLFVDYCDDCHILMWLLINLMAVHLRLQDRMMLQKMNLPWWDVEFTSHKIHEFVHNRLWVWLLYFDCTEIKCYIHNLDVWVTQVVPRLKWWSYFFSTAIKLINSHMRMRQSSQ